MWLTMSRYQGRLRIGLNAPAKKNCGKKMNGKRRFAERWFGRRLTMRAPNDAPKRATSTSAGMIAKTWASVRGIPKMMPKAITVNACGKATSDSPRIFPARIVRRPIGATKISWLKSFSRSSRIETSPSAADCHTPCASCPAKMKGSRSIPGDWKFEAKAPPSTPIKRAGKTRPPTSRIGSRRSFVTSRAAIAPAAASSLRMPKRVDGADCMALLIGGSPDAAHHRAATLRAHLRLPQRSSSTRLPGLGSAPRSA